MKYPVLIYFFVFFLGVMVSAQEKIKDSHLSGVPAIRQKSDMACWITVYTMMKSWKDRKIYKVEQVATELGKPWSTFFLKNTGLPPEKEKAFMARTGLKSEPPASYMLSAYADWLQQYGPVWIVTGNLGGRHARLLVGISGDGTYDKTEFIFIDPASGKEVEENSLKFFEKYEQEAKLANIYDWQFHLQIFHF